MGIADDFKKYGEELGEELIALAKSKGADIQDRAIGLGKELWDWAQEVAEAKLKIAVANTAESRAAYEEDLQYAEMALGNVVARAEIQANTELKNALLEAGKIALDITLKAAKGILTAYIPIPSLG